MELTISIDYTNLDKDVIEFVKTLKCDNAPHKFALDGFKGDFVLMAESVGHSHAWSNGYNSKLDLRFLRIKE